MYRDRTLGLVVFGSFVALAGLLFGVIAWWAHGNHGSVLKPALLAVLFVGLGVGSILQKRWARALILIVSWSWLVLGAICTSLFGFLFPDQIRDLLFIPTNTPQRDLDTGLRQAKIMSVILLIIILAGLLIAVPAVLVLFYRSANVKATCEARNPRASWTDACPLPVLGASLWIACSSVTMGIGALSRHSIFAAFGTFIVGPASSLLYLLFVAISGYCAWSLYKMDRRALWLFAATLILLTVSSAITYSRHDVTEIYALMGYPAQKIATMKQMRYLRGNGLRITTILTSIPALGYLYYLRRYFPPVKIPGG